jgi:hypothetical protein
MAAVAVSDADDIAIWKEGLTAANLADLIILIDPIPPAELDITNTTAPTVTARKTRVNAWLKFIGEQNTILLIPIMHIQRLFLKRLLAGFVANGAPVPPKPSLTLRTETFKTAADINGIKDINKLTDLTNEYLSDIYLHYDELWPILKRLTMQGDAFLNMGGGTNLAILAPTNKIEWLFRTGLVEFRQKQNFIGFLTSPFRTINILMERILDHLKMYANNKNELIKDIQIVKNMAGPEDYNENLNVTAGFDKRKAIKGSIIEQKISDCKSVAVLKTNMETPRDGWVQGSHYVVYRPLRTQGAEDPYPVSDFWFDFLTKMAEQLQTNNTFTVARFAENDTYGIIAAKLLIAKLNNQKIEDLFTVPLPATSPWAIPANFSTLPNGIYHPVEYKPGKTLEMLYKTLDHGIHARLAIHINYQLNLA